MGLESMRFHAAEVGGDLAIESRLKQGTLVRLHVFNKSE
jgi:nitrate/nitrite-specific signal transduction histidine kinase